MRHPTLNRVAEVIVGDDRAGYTFGTGYRLGRSLVLTAAHLVADGTNPPEVRLGLGGGWHPAPVVWRGALPEFDLALLELPPDAPSPEPGSPRLGRLAPEPARRVEVVATGFPAFNASGRPPIRDTAQLIGSVSTHSNRRTLRLEVNRADRLSTRGEAWSGMSGSAVFAHGFLIGVVAAADRRDVPLYLTSVESVTSDEEFWRLLARDGVEPRCHIAVRRPAYLDYVRRQADRVGELRDRAAELDAVWAFARSQEPYRWLNGPPWAGKSALAACAAADPPPDIDVVAFFVSRAMGAQTPQFLREVCDQLAALLDEDTEIEPSQAILDTLWQRACERSERLGRDLLMIVDGLDENDVRPSIATLLPPDTGARGHVLVLSRSSPPVPAEMAPGHPLRERGIRADLSPSPYAGELRVRAHADLAELLQDPDSRQVVGMLAVAGPMTADELADVLSVDRFVVAGITTARVLVAAADDDRSGFAHEQLRDAARTALGDRTLAHHRASINDWADRYAQRGWPADTPAYLFEQYRAFLTDDHARLAALPSPARIALWQRRLGHDAGATAELNAVLNALATADDPDLAAMCTLAERRHRLLRPLRQHTMAFPCEIPVAWARKGEWSRAEYLASHITGRGKLSAFVGMAEIAARAGDMERFQDLAAKAAASAEQHDPVPEAVGLLLARLATIARDAGDPDLSSALLEGAQNLLAAVLETGDEPGRAMFIAPAAVYLAELGERPLADRLLAKAVLQVGDYVNRDMDPFRFSTLEGDTQEDISTTAVAIAKVRTGSVTDEKSADRLLGLRHPYDQSRALADFARVVGPGAGKPLIAAAERAVGAIPSVPRPVRLRNRAEPVDVLIARAAAYAAEAAAAVGEDPAAVRLANTAEAHCDFAGEADTRADTWARVAAALESTGQTTRTDKLLDRIERIERTGDDIIWNGNPVAACLRCAKTARTTERARSLLMRAERSANLKSNDRWLVSEISGTLAAAVAESGDPGSAEQIISRHSAEGGFDQAAVLIRPLVETGDVARAKRIVGQVSADHRKYAEKLLRSRPETLAESNVIRPDRLRDILSSARRAAGWKRRSRAQNLLVEALNHAPVQAAGAYKVGMQYARIGVVATEIGEADIAEQLLAYLMTTLPYAAICVPLQAALAKVSDHERALELLHEAQRLTLADEGPFSSEQVQALLEAAAAVDRPLARRFLATGLARSANTRDYLAEAVRVDAGLTDVIIDLITR